MALLGYLSLILVLAAILEKALHDRRLARLPLRIHVNGTRGKSTVTRLIAAGLRAGGYRAVAKTTGTAPRLILEDGTELPIHRRGRPRIIEQVWTVRQAYRRRADALVVECMALHPENQWASEDRMLHATIGVITNVRPDHLEIMGPALRDAAEAMSLTVPRAGHLVTAEREFLAVLRERAAARGTAIHEADGMEVPEAANRAFPYLSFRENVACALLACEIAGVPRETALRAMLEAPPDPGALTIQTIRRAGGEYILIDGCAANDALSTELIWRRCQTLRVRAGLPVIAVLNNRGDRIPRIVELARLLGREIRPDRVLLVGQSGFVARRLLERAGFAAARIKDFTSCRDPGRLMALGIEPAAPEGAVIFSLGNAKGLGLALARYFASCGRPQAAGEELAP